MLACTWESILLIEETVDARDLGVHELFSGAEAIAKAHVLLGLTCLGQDKCKDEREDVIQSAGLTLAIWRALRTKKGGVAWAAMDCSTVSWIARGSTGRTKTTPSGHVHMTRVRDANFMIGATTLVLLLRWLRDVRIVGENPINSVLAYVEPLKTLLLHILGTLQRTVTVYLGSYDAPSLKPLWLWSDWDAIHKLKTKRPKKRTNGEPFDKLAARGNKWTNGVKHKLKASQAYTSEFGMAAAKLTRAEQAGAHRTVAQRLQCEHTEPQREWGEVKHILVELFTGLDPLLAEHANFWDVTTARQWPGKAKPDKKRLRRAVLKKQKKGRGATPDATGAHQTEANV